MTEPVSNWRAYLVDISPPIPPALRPAFGEFLETGDEQALRVAVAAYRTRRCRQRTTYPRKWRRR